MLGPSMHRVKGQAAWLLSVTARPQQAGTATQEGRTGQAV